MHTQADLVSRLEDLKGVTDRLSIEIITDNLFDPEITVQSGHCKIKGKNTIITVSYTHLTLPTNREV